MIKTAAIFDYKTVDGLIAFARVYPEYAAEVAVDVWKPLEPKFMDELTFTPGPVEYPIDWTTELQRHAFFASDGFGRGIPTERTGKMQDSWYTRLDVRKFGVAITVANSRPETPFVVGDLIPGRRKDPMQQFHKNTGWQPVADTVAFWQGALADAYVNEWDTRLDQLPIFR